MFSRSLRGISWISIASTPRTLRRIVDMGHAMKRAGKRVPDELRPAGIADAVLMLIFEKPSTRTRVSFDVAMRQLGGQSLALNHTDMQIGRGEPISDTAKVLSRYVDAIMIRANKHETLRELAEHATVPVINGLTDRTHPCQIVADIMTFEERLGADQRAQGGLERRRQQRGGLARSRPPRGSTSSWRWPARRSSTRSAPSSTGPRREGGDIELTDDADAAVAGADCVVTDTWVSMGQEQDDTRRRKQLLAPYAVDADLMRKAAPGAIFLHCLPAYRGNEVAAEVIDGPQSAVWDEAENRLHAQKAILAWCLGVD